MTSAPRGYHWLHIPSSKAGTSEFSQQQAVEANSNLGSPYFDRHGMLLLSEAYELINKWNAAQPLVWKYWL